MLEDLKAQSDIRRLLSLYCDAVSRRDAEAVGELFTEDARVVIAGGTPREGRAAVVAGLAGTISRFSFLHQKADTGLIDVNGDRARSRIGVMEANLTSDTEVFAIIFGTYEDEYKRTDAGWRFHRRTFTMQFRTVLPTSSVQHFPPFVPEVPFAP